MAGGLTHLRTQVFTLATLAPFIHTTLAKCCHISTVYSHTTLAKSLITACCFFYLPQSRCVREALCSGSCLCLLVLGGLTCLRCCAVGGLTHLRTQVFTTLATLATFVHTPHLLKVSLPPVFFYLPQSRCSVSCLCLLLLGGLTRLRCCAVGGLTHLRTQVFTTLATLAPFIHTTLAKSCHISTVYSHTTLAKSLITACFFVFFYLPQSRCVREACVRVYLLLLGGLTCLRCCTLVASPTCGCRYSPHLPH